MNNHRAFSLFPYPAMSSTEDRDYDRSSSEYDSTEDLGETALCSINVRPDKRPYPLTKKFKNHGKKPKNKIQNGLKTFAERKTVMPKLKVALQIIQENCKRIQDLKTLLETKDLEISCLTAGNKELIVSKSELQSEVNLLRQTLAINQEEILKLNGSIATFKAEISHCQPDHCDGSEVHEADVKISQQKTIIDDLKKQLDFQIQKNKAEQEICQGKISQLKTAFDNVHEKISTFENEVTMMQTEQDGKMSSQQTRIRDLEEELKVQIETNAAWEMEKANLKATIKTSGETITSLEKEKAALERDFEQLEELVDELLDVCDSKAKDMKISHQKAFIDDLKKELDFQIQQNKADKETSSRKLSQVKMAFDNLHEKISTFEEDVMMMQMEQDDKMFLQQITIQDLEEELEVQKETTITNLENEKADLEGAFELLTKLTDKLLDERDSKAAAVYHCQNLQCDRRRVHEADVNVSQQETLNDDLRKELDFQIQQNKADKETSSRKLSQLKMAFDNLHEKISTFENDVMMMQME